MSPRLPWALAMSFPAATSLWLRTYSTLTGGVDTNIALVVVEDLVGHLDGVAVENVFDLDWCSNVDAITLAQAEVKLLEQLLNLRLGLSVDDIVYGAVELSDGAFELSSKAVEDVVGDLDGVAVQDVGDGDGRIDSSVTTLSVAVEDVVGHINDVAVEDVLKSDCRKPKLL